MRNARVVGGSVAVALVASIALAGCTASPGHKPTPTPTSTVSSALGGLVPSYPAALTAATAKSGSVTAMDAIQGLIAPADIASVDDDSKLVAATKTSASYYGVARGIATVAGFDPIEQAEAMEKLLIAAGWTEREAKATTARYAAVLTTNSAAGTSVLGLQAVAKSTKSAAVVLITIESPDIPAK